MAEIFNFQEFKEMRQASDQLENDYLNFLPWINNKLGVPTDIKSVSKVLFIVVRYLEGTINAFSILATLSSVPRDQLEEGKKALISWLQELIEQIKLI